MEIKKVMVVGSGAMGSGIIQILAQNGYEVVMNEMRQESLDKAMAKLEKNYGRNVEKGRMTEEDKEASLKRITTSTDKKDAKDCQLIIEAATENRDIKLAIFRELDEYAPEGAILATNTSSLSITDIAAATNRPDRVIGMHFFNPVPVMKLVEVIRGLNTSDETTALVVELSKRLGKTPVEIKDSPGFAVNRLLIPMINEAIFALYEGVATAEEIDTSMKLGANHPMGPIALADYIGLDVVLAIMNVLYTQFRDPKYRACPLLVKHVEAGYLGIKTGRGFYDYSK